MALKDEQIKGGIRFGDWMLAPLDDRKEPQWHRLGRFYSFNTFHLAVQYAADVELKAKAHGRVMELEDALHEYGRIVESLKADVIAALGEVA